MTCSNNPNHVVLSGDVLFPQIVGNKYANATLTSTNGTTPVTLFTAPVGYVITELGMQVDDTSTIASAGMISTKFTDSSFGDFFVIRWFIPSAFAAKTAPSNNRQTNGPGFYWNNKVAGTSVSVSLDTALTSGQVRFFARYALTSNIGT